MDSLSLTFNSNSDLVSVVSKRDDISSFKTLPLKDVVNIFSSFNNNSLNRDTGFILDNLKRHVNVNGTDYYFFSYDAITMCPGLTVFESEYEVLNDYFSEFFHSVTDSYDSYDDEDIKIVKLKPMIIPGVILSYTCYASGCRDYNVLHAYNPDSFLPDFSLNGDTILLPSLFQNHFKSSICWGETGYSDLLTRAIRSKDLNFISKIPQVYLNTIFNYDLIYMGYDRVNTFIKKDLFKKIMEEEYKLTNYDSFCEEARQEDILYSYSEDTFQVNSLLLHYMILAYYFKNLDLYVDYLKNLYDYIENNKNDSDNNIITNNRTISQYIKSKKL